jgi:hypothetical protein
MTRGICVGCNEEGTLKYINGHIQRCPQYAERFRSGEDILDPGEAYQRSLAGRKPAPVARQPRAPRPEVSPRPARVAAPKKAERAPAGAVERTPGPVSVEVWEVPAAF